jgi:hypothetical protein
MAEQRAGRAEDVLHRSRRRTRVVCTACGLAFVGTAAWAVLVPRGTPIELPNVGAGQPAAAPPAPRPLDTAAFSSATLWTVPETDVQKVAAAAPPPPPLRVQLLGIIKEGDAYKGVLFDPDTSKLLVVGTGDAVQGRNVERVAGDALSIRHGALLQVLALKPAGAAP